MKTIKLAKLAFLIICAVTATIAIIILCNTNEIHFENINLGVLCKNFDFFLGVFLFAIISIISLISGFVTILVIFGKGKIHVFFFAIITFTGDYQIEIKEIGYSHKKTSKCVDTWEKPGDKPSGLIFSFLECFLTHYVSYPCWRIEKNKSSKRKYLNYYTD